MKCPKCGAGNPDYAVYCGSCSALIKEAKRPRYRNEPSRKGSRIVIEGRWARFRSSLRNAAPFIVLAAILLFSMWLYLHMKHASF